MKRGLIIKIFEVLIIILLSSMAFSITQETDWDSDSGEEQEEILSTPIAESSYYQPADSEVEDSQDQLDLSATTENYEALEGEFNGVLKTEDWEAEGTFSNLVVGNGGIYEAVITGVSAGTTMYFLSTFDDQIFKFTKLY